MKTIKLVVYVLLMVLGVYCIASAQSINDLEYQKFQEDSEGNVAVNAVISSPIVGDLEISGDVTVEGTVAAEAFVGSLSGQTTIGDNSSLNTVLIADKVDYSTTTLLNSSLDNTALTTYHLYDSSFADDDSVMLPLVKQETELLSDTSLEGTYVNVGSQLDIVTGMSNGNMDAGVDTAAEETTIVHSGTSSQKIIVDSTNEGVKFSQFTVNDEKIWYKASCWVYVSSGTVRFSLAMPHSPYYSYGSIRSSVTGAWQKLEVVAYASELFLGTKLDFVIEAIDGGATFYVDDVSLVKIGSTLPNGYGTFTVGTEQLSYGYTQDINVLEDCEDPWNEQAIANVTLTESSVLFTEGTKSAKFTIADAFTTGIIGSEVISKNLSQTGYITFDVRSSVALADGDYGFKIDDTANCASSFNLPLGAVAANTWTSKILSITPGITSSVNLQSTMISIGLSQLVDKGAMDLYIDNVKYVEYDISVDGTAKVAKSDSDGNVCFFSYGSGYPKIKNRLGESVILLGEATID